jgi:hypothetical protein
MGRLAGFRYRQIVKKKNVNVDVKEEKYLKMLMLMLMLKKECPFFLHHHH